MNHRHSGTAVVFAFAVLACTPRFAAAQSASTLSTPSCSKPLYPKEALRYELEGAVVVRYRVTPDGRAAEPTIVRSSGWRLLDDATVQNLMDTCRFTPEQVAAAEGKTYPLKFVWSLDRHGVHPPLVPDSCHESTTFAGLIPSDGQPSDGRGLKVRYLVDAAGKPFGVKHEGGSLDTALAGQLQAYVESCRFAWDPKTPPSGYRTDAQHGRVLLR